MTRVNGGVAPWELPRQALIAEHREITRIPNAVRRNPKIASTPLPKTFRFGEGHVRFFYDKLGYLHNRYMDLYRECRKRGYNVTCKSDAFLGLPPKLVGDWSPELVDRNLTLERLKDRGHRVIGQKLKVVKLKALKYDRSARSKRQSGVS